MLNRALMSRKPQLLHCFQFLIKDLHTRLEQLHRQYLSTLRSLGLNTLKLYRGVCLTQKVLDETIRNCKGGFIGFDSFLSTSLKKEVAERFANLGKTKENQVVIFQIEINVHHMKQPFAEISRYSAVPKEQEVLFSFGTVFRIQDVIEPNDHNPYYTVNLSSVEETNNLLSDATQEMNKILLEFLHTICEKNKNNPEHGKLAASFANLARVYYNQNDYDNSLDYYKKARHTLEKVNNYDPLTMANYISNIAMIYADRAESETANNHESEKKRKEWRKEALNLYKEALDIRDKECELDDPSLIDTLRTMGELYDNLKDNSEALRCYQNAFKRLNSIKKPESRDYSSIGVTLIMIGQISNQQEDYDKALEHFKLALTNYEDDASQFLVKRLEAEGNSSRSPSDISMDEKLFVLERNPVVALLYNNIGAMHYKMENYQESLTQQLKCMEVEKKNLPEQHETFVDTYENIAGNYDALFNYDLAIDYIEKAIRQCDFIKDQEKKLEKQNELNNKLEQLKDKKKKI